MSGRAELPFRDWPLADRVMWEGLCAGGGPLDEVGAFAHMRPRTQAMLRSQYGRWLGWLAETAPETMDAPPPARAGVERFRGWIEGMAALAPASRGMFAKGALTVLRAATPERTWTVHIRLVKALEREAAATRGARKLGRVLSSAVLLEAGLELAGARADAATTMYEAATRRRDGTMIALLALLPMRLRAFTALELGTSLLRGPRGFTVALSPEMTKTGMAWEAEVPDVAAAPLLRYVDEVRPWLMARRGRRHSALWVNGQGAVFSENYLSTRVSNATLAMTGVRVPPHFFRDAAATTLTRLSPESARLVRPLLAHSGFETAERHYIHAQAIETARDFGALLTAMRGGRRR